jgi:threonyl-tRNA synthetase
LVHIRLPDGQSKEYQDGITVKEVLADNISGAQVTAIAVKIDGLPSDLSRPINVDCSVEPILPDSSEGLEIIRHSASHVMAQAVLRLWPDAKLAIGPAIDDGFYYDIDMEHRLVEGDLPVIQKEMKKIAKEKAPFVRAEQPAAEALLEAQNNGDIYKAELIEGIIDASVEAGGDASSATISTYTNGDFVDLCRGPHVSTTRQIGSIKLLSIAGAYWRGDEKNKMLQRIYGTAFPNKDQLQEHLALLEEAKKRDHRRLGKDLDLYSTDDLVGPGLVLWHPKGGRIRTIMEQFWREAHYAHGYEIVYTPHIGRLELWDTSGHTSFYRENMYSPMDIDERQYQIKPMNCPFHIAIYRNKRHSYREFPLRWAELGTVYRYEKTGVLHGLLRARGFTQDDAHVFCRIDQLSDEIQSVLDFTLYILRSFGFEDFDIALSTQPDKFVGEQANWDKATDALKLALGNTGLEYIVQEGEGAFYGPKIDVNIRDSLKRVWQCSTIQVDFNIPERFNMTYTGSDGEEHQPIMIHRALMGSVERFFGCLVEHYGGAFPLWLAPVQAVIIPITDRQHERAQEVRRQLAEAGIRVEIDDRSEKMGAKIREHTTQKVPYMLVIGDREAESGEVAVRRYKVGDQGASTVDALIESMAVEVAAKGRSAKGRSAKALLPV